MNFIKNNKFIVTERIFLPKANIRGVDYTYFWRWKRDFSSRKINKGHLLVDWRGGDSTPAGLARAENPFISALAEIN